MSELLSTRLGRLTKAVRDAPLVASALARPAVDLAGAVCTSASAPERALRRAAEAGLVELRGGSVAFTHPLLASVMYAQATAPELRRLRRRLTPPEAIHDVVHRMLDAADQHVAAGDTTRVRVLFEEVLGYAVLAGVASSATASYLATHPPGEGALAQVHGFRSAFLVATGVTAGCSPSSSSAGAAAARCPRLASRQTRV